MTQSERQLKPPSVGESKGSRLVIISGGVNRRRSTDTIPEALPTVKQSRLAEIQELEARIAYDTHILKVKRRQLRHDLNIGSRVEMGPLRAYFDLVFVSTKRGKRFQRSRLIVR